jgi:hypothetical protein
MKISGLANMKIHGLGDFNMETKQNKLPCFIDRCSFMTISKYSSIFTPSFQGKANIAKLYTSRLKANPDVYAC